MQGARASMFAAILMVLLAYVFHPMPGAFTQASTSPFSKETAVDRDALLQFKAGLSKPSATVDLWNSTSDFCQWPGVACSHRHRGRVSTLNLSSAGIVGTISPSIGNLTFLRILDLSYNMLEGEIPSTIGRLWRLQFLNFSGNSLHGGIPDGLSNCTNLINIMLDKNNLTGGIPPSFGGFPRLVALLLSKNNLSGIIPPSLGKLSSLDALYLHTNHLEGSIPEDLGKINKVKWLAIYANVLSGTIPEAVFNLSSVVAFGLDQNDLHGALPPNWGNNQPNLIWIFLALNHLTGSVPASLANATKLYTHDVGVNNFSGKIPPAIGTLCPGIFTFDANKIEATSTDGWEFITLLTNCTRLKVLSFQYNILAGELPGSVANLSTKLQIFYTGFNKIYGTIPPGIGNLVGLQKLQLSENHLTSDLPSTIGQLKNLQALWVDGNKLSGTIHSIGYLTQLQLIRLDNNNFQGSIPVSFMNLQQLSAANLSYNAFTGPLPKAIFNISFLSYILDLSNNNFYGSLPLEVGSLTKLSYLNISHNNLSGSLPDTLSNCQSLLELHLDCNSFSGSLPTSISKMSGLVVLNLTNNSLSGSIPQELGHMKGIEELYVAHNKLSGQIPFTLQNMTSLFKLDISFNHLSGQVPGHGVFANSTGFFFVGNDGLCGGIQKLDFPACPVQTRKHRNRVILVITIPTGSLLCFVLVCLFFYWRKKKGAHSATKATTAISFLDDKYPKVSYVELVQSTDGFSATNLIGRGRYGSVYKARLSLQTIETDVAVKVFDLQQSGSSKSFVAECESLSRIRHRNLISVITCCSSTDTKQNNFKAIVFEFMANLSLDKWLHDPSPGSQVSGPIPGLTLMQRLNIAVNVADAIDYLHNNCEPPIVHCDLKPSNVLLSADFVSCVGDFGIARILSVSGDEPVINSMSSTGIRGTIGYVAPEYAEGGQVSLCGDVFSFGVLLLEMFTGKAPTDAMFVDGLTLPSFVEKAFPEKMMDVVDPVLLSADETMEWKQQQQHRCNGGGQTHNAIISVTGLAMSCCKSTPSERMSMRDAAIEMHKIRDSYVTELSRQHN